MKLLLFHLVLILISPNELKEYLKKGDDFHNKFDNVNAVLNYEKAFEIAPDNYEVLLKLTIACNDAGEEYFELRKRNEAEKYIIKAVQYAEAFKEKFPDSADAYCYYSMSYGNLALFKGGKEKIKLSKVVEENAKKSIELNPNQFVAYVILGIYNREISNLNFFERLFANTFFGGVPNGSFEEAIKMFNIALRLIPESIVPTFHLSKTYRYMGDKKIEKDLLNKLFNYKIENFRDKFALEKAKRRLSQL